MLIAFIGPLAEGLDACIAWFNQLWPAGSLLSFDFMTRALLAVTLVAFLCGAMGSIVVGSRMAFFSDALAHCAFAGVAMGLLVGLLLGVEDASFRGAITTIMVGFGLVIGLLIAFVRERTGLSSDTVIGVFFAFCVGLGGMFQRAAQGKTYFQLEKFIFGDPVFVTAEEILWLAMLVPLTIAFLWRFYNPLLFGNFNPSLARSRQLPYRLATYLFIGLLALIINFAVQVVGVLLITGMLIVPAATSTLISRNMRQFVWYAVGLSVACGVAGVFLTWEVRIPDPTSRAPISFGIAGTIVVLAGMVFVVCMWLGRRVRRVGSP